MAEPKSMDLLELLQPTQDGEEKFHQSGISRSAMDLPRRSNSGTRYKQRGSRHGSGGPDLVKKTLSHS